MNDPSSENIKRFDEDPLNKPSNEYETVLIETPLLDVLIHPKTWWGYMAANFFLKENLEEALSNIMAGRWIGVCDLLYGQHAWSPGRRLQHWRYKRKLSQRELAALSGVDMAYISRIESGQRHPGRQTAIRLAAALNCPYLHLL